MGTYWDRPKKIGDVLPTVQKRMPPRTEPPSPGSTVVAPVHPNWPSVACPQCHGSGGYQGGCPTCEGTGVVCPGCKGAGWTASQELRKFATPAMLTYCPICNNDALLAAAEVKRLLGRGGAT